METDASLLSGVDAASTRRDLGEVTLHVVAAGDPGDPLVVLLHGFPDFWYGWRDQIGPLVEAGFRVVVPDQRGYNRSDAPEGLDAYRLPALSGDVRALVGEEGRESAHVVGHDWGGGVAWDLALRHPDVVDRLAAVNSPHPSVFEGSLRSSPRQLLRSWYVLAFQLPRLPEWWLGRADYAGLATVVTGSANEGTFDEATLQRYRAAWRRHGPGPMVDWYRAARRAADPPRETVPQPTLVCWGEQDVALAPSMAADSVAYCEDGRLERFPEGSHWAHLECPGVTDALLEHLSAAD
jgi:pimeloyl-ACP methyl ester carboxylesterase